jgi:hypothetical protein
VRRLSEFGSLAHLVVARAEVEVAAKAQLELVAVLGDAPPDLQRLHC